MSNQRPNAIKKGKQRDPDLAGAEAAMMRAARRARERTRRAGGGVFILRDGQIVEEHENTQDTDHLVRD